MFQILYLYFTCTSALSSLGESSHKKQNDMNSFKIYQDLL